MNIQYIVVHCSATRINRPYTLKQLIQDHQARGMRTAGYHFYIPRNGIIIPIRGMNSPGAHVRGYNYKSIGICYEGGLLCDGSPSDTRTLEQRAALVLLLRMLRQCYPQARIVGHRDLSPDLNHDGTVTPNEWTKQCPCFDAKEAYAHL
ncbi:MAG: N-acetylmuramoyl-L-alanine amidase [Bacteroidales bacterium]|nr:N-acetylmuramoyl-L-alanine amidase [Porphyromonas sp.]MDD6934960.1 N-acetylmuramoyl-L-alanine amidase [Bacteroidales bacterium]MDY3102461.1 N-acetylmuramoyl-L-alanine amidase [Porphyromonas sp.]